MRPMIVVAHPDDETLGAASCLIREPGCTVVHVTDGAPRDRRLWPQGLVGTREAYADLRRGEFERVAGLVGLGKERWLWLGVVDLEVVHAIERISERLAEAIAARSPTCVLSHAYEGGHPDHDAVAVACRGALELLRRGHAHCPELFEFALYHGHHGHLTLGSFLPGTGPEPLTVVLTGGERALRRRMLDCYASQQEIVRAFLSCPVEQRRPAAAVDFTTAPHEGLLYYQRCGLPVDPAEWRATATAALRRLDARSP